MHSFVHGRRLGVIPSKRAKRDGSGSVQVEEVDVLGALWKVVVHATVVELGACVTRVFGDGSHTWFRVVLASSDLLVSILATVAVYVSFSERYLESFEIVGLVISKGCLAFPRSSAVVLLDDTGSRT